MNVYKLEINRRVDYDCMQSCVVVAETESEARDLAQKGGAEEAGWHDCAWRSRIRTPIWATTCRQLNGETHTMIGSSCVLVATEAKGQPRMLCRDVRWG